MSAHSFTTPLIVSAGAASGRESQCEPVTLGVPFPRGFLREPSRLRLADDEGGAVPLQTQATERWPDGSVRWALLDFLVTGRPGPTRRYQLFTAATTPPPVPRLSICSDAEGVVVDTGVARFAMRSGTAFPFSEVMFGGWPSIDGAASALLVTRESGACDPVRVLEATVEERGPIRGMVRLDGIVGPLHRPLLIVVARLRFVAGSAAIRTSVTLRNPRRARHRGGYWELGDRGSAYLRDVSLRLALSAPVIGIDCTPEVGAPTERFELPLELYQDSSGGDRWRHRNHVNRHGEVRTRHRGYQLTAAGVAREGRRATPAAIVRYSSGRVGVAVEHFWQNFPQALEVDCAAVTLRLLPRQFNDVHELQGGEQKTYRFTLITGDDAVSRDAIFWGRSPSSVVATPEWYCGAGAVPHLSAAAEDCDDRYQRLINLAIEGDATFERQRETIDEYGWRNFGEIYADHENAYSEEPAPIVSHYNNQYDAIGGLGCQFMRSGDRRFARMMNELAWHVSDIDIYHTDQDKPAYNHGLFWHTSHYVPAGRSSHRSYPRHARVGGGGPANEHNYTSGLRLHWLLTGEPASRDAALQLAQWVVDMDDGRKGVLRWLSTADTGLASQTRTPGFHGPGRGAAHSILALLDGHRLTGATWFLAKAEQIIRRSIHPSDDVPALELLDAEMKWSYTVFLQALGKYLDYKIELNAIDGCYDYARAALLNYAVWMADHEYPYLEKPEILEYPTETWAAQDMRKCEVFLFAAGHASGSERERFLERADFFFSDSISTLLASETRALARPLVVLLSNGFMRFAPTAATPRPAAPSGPSERFGAPAAFVPRKAIAKKRLATAAAIVTAIAAFACLAAV